MSCSVCFRLSKSKSSLCNKLDDYPPGVVAIRCFPSRIVELSQLIRIVGHVSADARSCPSVSCWLSRRPGFSQGRVVQRGNLIADQIAALASLTAGISPRCRATLPTSPLSHSFSSLLFYYSSRANC